MANQTAFREAIMQERKVELAFESHRWYDLVRTEMAINLMNAHGQREITKNPAQYPTGSYVVTPDKLLLPIPEREITLDNDNLEQNP